MEKKRDKVRWLLQEVSLYIVLFYNREPLAAGWVPRALPLGADSSPTAIGRFHGPSPPDLDQMHGLDEADKSPAEGGTLLLPPSPAIAFPPLPSTRALLTVCASARTGRSAETKKLR